MTIQQILLAAVAAFSIVCIVAVLFFERKNPASSLVWVLVLLFFPVAGFVFYLFLGSGYRVNKRRRYAMKAASDDLYKNHLHKHLSLGRSRAFMKTHKDASRLLTYLKNQGDGIFTDDNATEMFLDGEAMFDRLLGDLRRATGSIHLLYYIFRNDALGREILGILEEKARHGVEVRLMYDSVGTLMARDTLFRGLKAAGGQVLAFSPIFSSLNSHLRLNYRNHRKIVVIDGRIGYVGGMNVGEEYRGKHPTLTPWRDTHLRLAGSAVWFLQERFFMDWNHSAVVDPRSIDVATYFPAPDAGGSMPMQIISSGPDTFESPIKSGFLNMIYAARKSVYIQTPYFAPDESIADALRIAARSDVDVRLMIPAQGDYRVVHYATLGYARDMHDVGVRVLFYKGFLHAKTMVVDGEVASIGTTNITNRSFTLDFEVNAFIYDTDFARRCNAVFHADEENCAPATDSYFSGQSLPTRALHNVARLLAPFM